MKDMSLQTLANVSTTLLALESIRAKNINEALELLERSLDAGLIVLNGLTKELEPGRREIAISTLHRVRDYRKLHPRCVKEIASPNYWSVTVACEAKERVGKMLDEIG